MHFVQERQYTRMPTRMHQRSGSYVANSTAIPLFPGPFLPLYGCVPVLGDLPCRFANLPSSMRMIGLIIPGLFVRAFLSFAQLLILPAWDFW